MDRGLLVDGSSGVLGEEDLALAVGGGRVMSTGGTGEEGGRTTERARRQGLSNRYYRSQCRPATR